MSDKSFGDHPNRNIVKNPLLSRAVTSLSIEDLTHKAVLLPVTPSQGQITKSDEQQQGSQTRALERSDHGTATLPSGDALKKITLSHTTPITNINTLDSQNIAKYDKNRNSTQSKTSVKSEDDFDVNEYIARLQGTRYVSAPLHSHLKEDNNANLEAKEENLEEINLNESQGPAEVQQSLTADIAQNFSQLPTVLPHVASAVFSSFSNMLNYKSREQTPDVNPVVEHKNYEEMQFQRPEIGVPLQAQEYSAPKEVGPPPKEPPVGGTGNFRLSTKKKYAQIPGLSSGESAQTMTLGSPTQNILGGQNLPPIGHDIPPIGHNIPQIGQNMPPFSQNVQPSGYNVMPSDSATPLAQNMEPFNQNESGIGQLPPQLVQKAPIGLQTTVFAPNMPPVHNLQTIFDTNARIAFIPDDTHLPESGSQHNIFNTMAENTNTINNPEHENLINVSAQKESNNFFTPIELKENVPNIPGSAPIIPPPPMFSNMPRKDERSQSTGKSILPPSVARRMSANQPIIKPQVSAISFTDNIFVTSNPEVTQSSGQIADIPGLSSSAFMSASSVNVADARPPESATSTTQSMSQIPTYSVTKSDSTNVPMISTLTLSNTSSLPLNSDVPIVSTYSGSTRAFNIPITASDVSPKNIPLVSSTCAVGIDVKSDVSNYQPASHNLPPPPTFFTPMQYTEYKDTAQAITQLPETATPEPSRSLPEPPKATASNFRMTKKRPQYYAGPIEGIGDISNNMKPIIPPVMPTQTEKSNLQATLFIPAPIEQSTEQHDTSNIEEAPVPFDISKPVETLCTDKPIELNVSEDYSAFNLRQSQNQTYAQEYNTAFDLSRATTDSYDAPKEESKGFGIIGSLKSKLSAIDINKIQNTVTMFFDPAFNDTKVPDALINEPLLGQNYSQQQHVGYQSNLEMYVAEPQSQIAGYDPNNQYYENQYYSQNFYSSSYFSAPNSNQQGFTDNSINVNTQTYDTSAAYAQEGFQDKIENTPASNMDSNVLYNPGTYVETNQRTSHSTTQNIDLVNQNIHKNVTFFNPNTLPHENLQSFQFESIQQKVEKEEMVQNLQAFNVNPHFDATLSYLNPSSHQTSIYSSPVTTKSQETEKTSTFFTTSTTDLQQPMYQSLSSLTDFDKPSSNTSSESLNAEECYDSALNTSKYNLSSIHTQPVQPNQAKVSLVSAANFFDEPKSFNLPQSAVKHEEVVDPDKINTLFETMSIEPKKSAIATPMQPIGSKSKTETIIDDKEVDQSKEKNIIETLSKNKIPVLAVSNVPLFGLSALATEKTKDISDAEVVSMFDTKHSDNAFGNNSGASFFESKTKESILGENLPKDPSVLKISDVKNVLLIEPPRETIGAVLKRNASSSKLETAKTEEFVCDHFRKNIPSSAFNENLNVLFIDKQNESFFKHTASNYIVEQSGLQNNIQTENEGRESSELNICETCREVNTPDPDLETTTNETEDLTSQLIENITSRMRLSNPLTVPFTEDVTSADQLTKFADRQLQKEITDIADDTIVTLQVQSATDLLDEEITSSEVKNFGWTQDAANSSTALRDNYEHTLNSALTTINDHNYGFNIDADVPTNADHDYEFKLDPNAIGFFGNNSFFFENIPRNASDEIKAEIKNTHEDIVLPRQMSIPSAPPAEDDTKSDETGGLDVLSIEQDAKKDFPLDEEFIIEPSETDDDKIEVKERKRSSEDSTSSDTFTNRVERFKKAADHFNDDIFEQKETQVYNTAPLSMASYFDTGNYAVESHYKKSVTPVQMPMYNYQSRPSYEYISIPPGFEEHFKNMLKGIGIIPNAPYIPDTTTQTHPILTPTFTSPQDTNKNILTRQMSIEETVEPFSQVFAPKTETVVTDSITKPVQTMSISSNVITQGGDADNLQILSDPMNFFSNEELKSATQEEPESLNRLASYFSIPPAQPDHSKSFFELSESQNHYRHETSEEKNPNKSYFELSQSQNHYIDNITKNNIANLMLDLTSPQNLHEQVVTTVNHFTVEYDNKVKQTNNASPIKIELANDDLKTEPDTVSNHDKNLDPKPVTNETEFKLVENETKTVLNCKYCAYLIPELCCKLKVKTAVSENTEVKNTTDMLTEKDPTRKQAVTINMDNVTEQESHDGVTVVNEHRITSEYSPVKHHWFYRVDVEDKSVWRGFSATDSLALETSFNSPDLDESTLVATDGGRYDVNIVGRLRIAVYWKEKPTNVRRCSWFYKGTTDARYVPYTETVAEKLEEEYRHGVTTGEWHRKLGLPNSEMVIMHGPSVMVHFLQSGATDAFSTPPQATSRPRVVRRGFEESEIEDCEPSGIDHLLLLCHGVGSACDLRFRSVEEVVDDFRTTSLQLLQSHYKNSYDNGIVNRVEVLPISWHSQLHSGETGVDSRLSRVTLDSIPRLRAFTNHTVLDVLFYTSPVFHQTIIDTVCSELNRIYGLFKTRNPSFKGNVSLGGHSLGSVILYDLLCHQNPETPIPQGGQSKLSSNKTYVSGTSDCQPTVQYPQLAFNPAALYALGSPISIFECIRGVESLGMEFALPTCRHFFNIFHPYDPIAYRIEPLINPQLQQVKPHLIPHHKGRKRMHLELKDTMARVGADLKQKLIESVRTTWNKWKACPPTDGQLEKVVEEEIEKEQLCEDGKDEHASDMQATPDMLGRLNSGRRVDYVLQEAPLEMINEYLFAMSSHVGYWESEDTMLLMLREVYSSLGVQPDSTVPQQCMSVHRTSISDDSSVNENENPSTSRAVV